MNIKRRPQFRAPLEEDKKLICHRPQNVDANKFDLRGKYKGAAKTAGAYYFKKNKFEN